MIGPMTPTPLFQVQCDRSELVPGVDDFTWDDLEKLVKEVHGDLVWLMHGESRVLLWETLANLWQEHDDGYQWCSLARTEARPYTLLHFRRDQTLPLEEYFEDLWQEHGDSPTQTAQKKRPPGYHP